jgi:hypothetical protein
MKNNNKYIHKVILKKTTKKYKINRVIFNNFWQKKKSIKGIIKLKE